MRMVAGVISLIFALATYPAFSDCAEALGIPPTGEQVRALAQKPQEYFDGVVAELREAHEGAGQIDAALVARYLLGKSDFISRPTDGNFLYYRVNFAWYRRDLRSITNKIHRALAR